MYRGAEEFWEAVGAASQHQRPKEHALERAERLEWARAQTNNSSGVGDGDYSNRDSNDVEGRRRNGSRRGRGSNIGNHTGVRGGGGGRGGGGSPSHWWE